MIELNEKITQRLDKHQIIAIDFDETLIYHKHSIQLWGFIIRNPDKKYWIITFRTGAYSDPQVIWSELYSESNLDRSCFEGIISIPVNLYTDYITKPGNETKMKYIRWKAEVAKSLNCTVLIDDRPDKVEQGCVELGIEFIDTKTLC